MTKVPYNPATGYRAYVNKPESFSDFETAVSALKDYDGLGIRVDGIIIAIDLDHCIKDGKLTTQAADIVSHFKNTYIERSPSGTGLRIILFVEDSYNYDKNNYYIKKGDIEVYVAGTTNRFVTITGDVYLDNKIVENMEALQWLLDKYMKCKTPKKSSAELQEHRESYLTDDGVLAKAMASKQGEKFRKLCNGDISDYPSNSEADLGFISIEGYGPSQIAKKLENDKVLTPSAYFKEIGLYPTAPTTEKPYAWVPRTVADILDRQEYLGHTVNFKTRKKSYKLKKTIKNAPSEWQIFKDTHEAIISEDTF